ncbi:MAG: protease inhibitor I42 family protein [Planctomycetota bacterium]
MNLRMLSLPLIALCAAVAQDAPQVGIDPQRTFQTEYAVASDALNTLRRTLALKFPELGSGEALDVTLGYRGKDTPELTVRGSVLDFGAALKLERYVAADRTAALMLMDHDRADPMSPSYLEVRGDTLLVLSGDFVATPKRILAVRHLAFAGVDAPLAAFGRQEGDDELFLRFPADVVRETPWLDGHQALSPQVLEQIASATQTPLGRDGTRLTLDAGSVVMVLDRNPEFVEVALHASQEGLLAAQTLREAVLGSVAGKPSPAGAPAQGGIVTSLDAPRVLRLDESHSGRVFEVVQGGTVEVSLPVDPTSGYGWTWKDDPQHLAAVSEVEETEGQDPRFMIAFEATELGEDVLVWEYRDDDGLNANPETYRFTVRVVAAGEAKQPGDVALGVAESGGRFEVRRGGTIEVSLPVDPSSGRGWTLTELPEHLAILVEVEETEGSNPRFVIVFEATERGTDTLTFEYRDDDGLSPNPPRYTYRIAVVK